MSGFFFSNFLRRNRNHTDLAGDRPRRAEMSVSKNNRTIAKFRKGRGINDENIYDVRSFVANPSAVPRTFRRSRVNIMSSRSVNEIYEIRERKAKRKRPSPSRVSVMRLMRKASHIARVTADCDTCTRRR